MTKNATTETTAHARKRAVTLRYLPPRIRTMNPQMASGAITEKGRKRSLRMPHVFMQNMTYGMSGTSTLK
jgi:hypothetical protein